MRSIAPVWSGYVWCISRNVPTYYNRNPPVLISRGSAPVQSELAGCSNPTSSSCENNDIDAQMVLDSPKGINYYWFMSQSTISTFELFRLIPDAEAARV